MSARTHRQVSLLAGLVLTAGVVAFTVAHFGDTGTSQETPLSDKPAQVFTPRKQVPLDTEARRVAGRFILNAVHGRTWASRTTWCTPSSGRG